MKIVCPHCSRVREARADDLLGRFFVCIQCKHIFAWEKAVHRPVRGNRNPNTAVNPAKQKPSKLVK